MLYNRSVLCRALQKSNVTPGFTNSLFSALKMKVNAMSELDKQCILGFDEMSVKTGLTYNAQTDSIESFGNLGSVGTTKYVSNHAHAFMVRGLASKWKQPVGYFLTSGTVTPVVLKTLVKNRSMIKSLNVTPGSPFFANDGNKIFVMFDPPHLIKNTRNNFRKHGFLWDEE